MIDVDYPQLLNLFPEHLDPKRTESASFLIWYLENYYRLDTREAVDCVCDQKGDKGVDGIFVDDNSQTITIFGSRISQRKDRTAGDAALRELVGAMAQFQDVKSVQGLMDTAANAQIGRLVSREKIIEKVGHYTLRGEFVTNINIDQNGLDYMVGIPNLTFVGKDALIETYVSDSRDIPEYPAIIFDIFGEGLAEYIMDENTKAVIVPIKATELVHMEGIADQSLFAYNVRGPLGRTQVNRDIANTIGEATRHKEFPLFHNGITVIAREVNNTPEKLTVRGYYVVNGCQSITTLFNNKSKLTGALKVLVKFIQADPKSQLAQRVTQYSNIQNGVRARDMKSNAPIQIRIKNEIEKLSLGEYYYEIKRGDPDGAGNKISNEDAGLYLMSFDLKEPWGTHRKYEVFEDRHADIFGRPEVTADRIVLLDVIMSAIAEGIPKMREQRIARYALIKYFILYVIREVLDVDTIFSEVSSDPARFVRSRDDRNNFKACVEMLVDDIVGDLNAAVELEGEDFDYRGKLRDSDWVKRQTAQIISDHRRLVSRGRMPSFKDEWEKKCNP